MIRLPFGRRKRRVTRADVLWAHARFVGGPAPDDATVEAHLAQSGSYKAFIERLAGSSEFLTRRSISPEGFVYDDSQRVQRVVRPLLAALRPMRVPGTAKIRVGKDFDGGYVMLDDFAGVRAAYSIGICNDVSWDTCVADRGIDVFQYDHTIDRLPERHPRFHWFRTGLAAVPSSGMDTLPRLVAANGHDDGSDLVLKCDIEGCEWEVFGSIDPAFLRRFRQIVLEIHDLHRLVEPEFLATVSKAVVALTTHHAVVHVHGNNYRPVAIVGGIPLPSVMEITLARAAGREMVPETDTFPTPLDMPCDPGRADHLLGTFAF